jgi:hypothetical protein
MMCRILAQLTVGLPSNHDLLKMRWRHAIQGNWPYTNFFSYEYSPSSNSMADPDILHLRTLSKPMGTETSEMLDFLVISIFILCYYLAGSNACSKLSLSAKKQNLEPLDVAERRWDDLALGILLSSKMKNGP